MAAAESQSLSTYLPALVQVALGLSIPAIILIASHVFGQRAKGNYIKDKAYECGLPMEGKPHPRFAVKFYVTAMLFILFDIEVVFLVPWALVYREFLAAGIAITAATAVFLGVLVLGLAYEFKRGALEWEK
ncbi:MAG: NADH-quinone oxidoreductase subunit A [Opitutales bacterium]|mgnify:FL=1|jgi:NADH-quinone oxidoreductase subunit A|nr:NADH-quinone oxidoreductase subunit A [Verrucomicrobiota bacterium]